MSEMNPKILKPGRYRLTKEFVGLAADPVRFFNHGDAFTVTEVAEDESVVFIPEFGGWTFYEIPAEPIEDGHNEAD